MHAVYKLHAVIASVCLLLLFPPLTPRRMLRSYRRVLGSRGTRTRMSKWISLTCPKRAAKQRRSNNLHFIPRRRVASRRFALCCCCVSWSNVLFRSAAFKPKTVRWMPIQRFGNCYYHHYWYYSTSVFARIPFSCFVCCQPLPRDCSLNILRLDNNNNNNQQPTEIAIAAAGKPQNVSSWFNPSCQMNVVDTSFLLA